MGANADNLPERQVIAAEKGVKTQKWSARIQTVALALTAFATAIAAYAAWQAGQAIRDSQKIASDQASENRFTSAISSIGGKTPTEQVAGLTLLRRAVKMQISTAMSNPGDHQEARDAYDEYSTALDIIPAYLHETTKPGKNPSIAADYAAIELEMIIKMGPNADQFGRTHGNIDLSSVGLAGVDWPSVNFNPLGNEWMPKIDLRGADLAKSHWGHAYLAKAHLQCADLRHADLSHATLDKANLSGADLTGAKLPPPGQRRNVTTTDTIGNTRALGSDHPGTGYDPKKCMSHKYANITH